MGMDGGPGGSGHSDRQRAPARQWGPGRLDAQCGRAATPGRPGLLHPVGRCAPTAGAGSRAPEAMTPDARLRAEPETVRAALELADFLLIAEAVLEIPAKRIAEESSLHLADSALHAPFACFGGEDFYPDFATKAAVLCAHLVKNHPLRRRQCAGGTRSPPSSSACATATPGPHLRGTRTAR